MESRCVVIAPTCIGYPIIKQCSHINAIERPTAPLGIIFIIFIIILLLLFVTID